MQTPIVTTAQTHRASTAVPAGFRARLAVVTAFLQRLPLPLIQLLFRLAIDAVRDVRVRVFYPARARPGYTPGRTAAPGDARGHPDVCLSQRLGRPSHLG